MDRELFRFAAADEQDTMRLATQLAVLLQPGSVLALDGDLGAGKTAFSKAIASRLGIIETVSSPTFTLIKEYEGAHMPLYHMDVYRLSIEEAAELGLEDYFYGAGVTIVEWAERIAALLPSERLMISIADMGGQKRLFTLIPYGQPYEQWCQVLKKNGVVQ